MALPTTVVTSVPSGTGYRNRAYISSGGNVYVLVAATSSSLKIYKATDPTSSFSAVTGGPTLSAVTSSSAVQESDVLHIATYDDTDLTVEYHKFDMSSDTWSTTNELIADVSGMVTPASGRATIQLRSVSGDELIVAYGGIPDTIMGTDYERVDFHHKDKTGSTWTGPVAIDAAGSLSYSHPISALGTSNKVHVAYDTDTSTGPVTMASISTSNTVSTPVDTAAVPNFNGQSMQAFVSVNYSSYQRLVLCTSSGFSFRFRENSTTGDAELDSPEYAQPYDVTTKTDTAFIVLESGTTNLHYLFIEAAASTKIDYDTSTDAGATWGTDALEYTGGSTLAMLDASYYERGGNKKIAYLYSISSNLTYNEKDLGSVGGASRRIFLIG